MTTIGTLAVNVVANTLPFAKGMKGGTKDLKGFVGQLNIGGVSLGQFATATGAVTAAVTIVAAEIRAAQFALREFNRIAEETDRLAKTARGLGLMTSDLQEFQYSIGLGTTISVQQFEKAMQTMVKRLAETSRGIGSSGKTFDILGIDPQQLQRRGVREAFLQIADAVGRVKDPAERARIAMELFGERAGTKLVSLMSEGRDAIEEQGELLRQMGGTTTPAASKAMEEYQNNIGRVNAALEAMKVTFANEFAPAMADGLDEIASLIEEFAKLNKQLNDAGLGIKSSAQTITFAMQMWRGFNDQVGKTGKLVRDALGSLGISLPSLEIANPAKITSGLPSDWTGRNFTYSDKPEDNLLTGSLAENMLLGASQDARDVEREMERLTAAMRTPGQVLEDQIAKLEEMRARGLGAGTYLRALREEFERFTRAGGDLAALAPALRELAPVINPFDSKAGGKMNLFPDTPESPGYRANNAITFGSQEYFRMENQRNQTPGESEETKATKKNTETLGAKLDLLISKPPITFKKVSAPV